MTTQPGSTWPTSFSLSEEQFFPGQQQLPADAIQQVALLSRSLYTSMAAAFDGLEDRRLHFNHLFPDVKGYSPHHCTACGLIARGVELLMAHYGHIGAFVRRILREQEQHEQQKAAMQLYAWVTTPYACKRGLFE